MSESPNFKVGKNKFESVPREELMVDEEKYRDQLYWDIVSCDTELSDINDRWVCEIGTDTEASAKSIKKFLINPDNLDIFIDEIDRNATADFESYNSYLKKLRSDVHRQVGFAALSLALYHPLNIFVNFAIKKISNH